MELVTAVLVTRGNVPMEPVLDSLPPDWDTIIWDNGASQIRFKGRGYTASFRGNLDVGSVPDVAVYGRYAALEEDWRAAKRYPDVPDLIYVQDDDVIVSDSQAIIDAWQPGHVVCNMPPEFRPHYPDSALVGFGACFERDLPAQAFDRFELTVPRLGLSNYGWSMPGTERFHRTCDVVFTTITPRILVDVPKTDREFASDPDRMWKQPGHVEERARMIELARRVRDA